MSKTAEKKKLLRPVLAAAVLATGVVILLLPEGFSRQIPVFLLLWIWPALAWGLLIRGHIISKFLLGAGLALFINAFNVLLVNYLPGSPPEIGLLFLAVAASLVPIGIYLLYSTKQLDEFDFSGVKWSWLLAIMLAALAFRLINMGYKELQGDEGIIMVRAASALVGDSQELLLHQKGPLEILLPMAAWAQTGLIEDFWARLPFLWAGLLVVLGLYWLGRQWFQENAGLAAALLFAVNGFGIAFSRIIQYQSLVMLFGILALIAAWRYKKAGRRWDLILCLVFVAASFLGHYDAILVLPAIGWILVGRVRDESSHDFWGWGIAIVLGAAISAAFYIPFVFSPSFEGTLGYLVSDRVGIEESAIALFGSAGEVWRMSTFYNSIWYILGLVILVLLGLWNLARQRLHFAAVLYFGVPFVFYVFFVSDPRTHVYTFFPGAVLLAGFGAVSIWNWALNRSSRKIRGAIVVVAVIWICLIALYPYLMFVDTSPERQRTWSENRPFPTIYPVTFEEPPKYGLFGFPHQAGWRMVPDLIDDNQLPYASNEEEEITNWYMSQAARTHCEDFNSFILTKNPQDEIAYDPNWLASLNSQNEVLVNNTSALKLLSRGVAQASESVDSAQSQRWLAPRDVAPGYKGSENEIGITLGDQVRLLGYDLDASDAEPGGSLIVTLHWEALAPFDKNYQVFVHLYDGEMRAQHDGAPECAIMPTTRWETGQIIVDPHIIQLPEEIPEGPVPLWVGMYELISRINLKVGGTNNDRIYLTDINIQS